MKKRKSSANSNLAEVKNIVRGALSKLKEKSKPNATRLPLAMEQAAKIQIDRAIARARRTLKGGQLKSFEDWLVEQLAEQSHMSEKVGSNLSAIGIFPAELKARALVEELRFACKKIRSNKRRISDFAGKAVDVGRKIFLGQYEEAKDALDEVVSAEGSSYWAVETDLAASYAVGGVEEMKKRAKEVSASMEGIGKFYAHYFGVRNEPSQVASRFRANLRKKIDDSNLSAELKAYSKFRLYGEIEKDTTFLAGILACEGITSVVDLIFTTLKVSRFILSNKSAFSQNVLLEAEECINELAFFCEHLGLSNVFSSGREGGEPTSRLMSIASRAVAMSTRPIDSWFEEKDEIAFIVRGVASRLSTRADGLHAEELDRLTLNVGWLPDCIEIGDVSAVPSLPEVILQYGKSEGIRVVMPLSILEAIDVVISNIFSGHFCGADEVREILRAMREVEQGEIDAAGALVMASSQRNPVVSDAMRVVFAVCFNEIGMQSDCVAICSEAGIENENVIPMLPLMSLFQGAKWASLKDMVGSIDLPISLDHFLRVNEERKIRTYKRYAVEELMKSFGVRAISEFPKALSSAGVDLIKVEYFVAHICDPVTLELIPGVGGSRKVKVLRSSILRELAAMHTPREAAYLREAEEVEEALRVDEGIQDLDESKIYVDERAVLNSVNKELAADFQRYLKLVESGVGTADELPELIKHFSSISMKSFQIPKNDADDLLFQIIFSISEAFLQDPASGLDIVIGRRIRHGTISSELRGVLERYELIGQRPRAGADYEPSGSIERRFHQLDEKKRKIVYSAFSRFSESIDQLVALLRDEYFHITSKKKPRGVFDVTINAMLLSLARSIAQTCQTIDQFSRECIALFWYVLSLRAEVARPKVEAEIKKTLQASFSRLMEELKALGVLDAAFMAHIQHASDELQRRASAIAGWIKVPKVGVEGKAYGLEHAVDVALAVVVGQKPAFKPIIQKEVPEHLMLDLHGFSLVEDALYIAIVNVYEHSGKKVDNNVDIKISFDEQSSLLRFSITNDVANSARTADRVARLDETRNDIQRRAYSERARRDRESGLCKLAALVMQHDKTEISFGFVGDKFKLDFDLLYLKPVDEDPNVPDLLFDSASEDKSPA